MVVRRGGCCGRCINRTPRKCRYVHCPRLRLVAGQKLRYSRGACCPTVVGRPKDRCAGKVCPRRSCRAGYVFRYEKGRCCGRLVKKSSHYTKIDFNVNTRVDLTTGVVSEADRVLRWAARKRQEVARRGRSLRKQAKRCLRRGPCRQRIASRAARISRDIRKALNRLRASRKACNGRRGCRRSHRQLAARFQVWGGRISRWAQFATHTSAELVSLAIQGFNQLNSVCRRASCVHGFAAQVNVLAKRLNKEKKACRNRRCRRRLNKAIKTLRRPVRKTLVPSLKVAMRVCTSRKCKRQIRKDLKRCGKGRRRNGGRRRRNGGRRRRNGGRRRRNGGRRRPAPIRKLERRANRLIQRSVKKINRIVARCRRQGASNRKLRKQLRKLHVSAKLRRLFRKAAKACRTSKCKQALRRDYKSVRAVLRKILPKRIVALPRRVSRVIRKGSRKIRKGSRKGSRKSRRVSRRCAAINKRRASLLKQIAACSEDDSKCVRKLFKVVAKLNRRRRGCKSGRARSVTLVDPLSIPNVDWNKEYTCSGLNSAWKKWLSRQRKIRKYFLAQAHACQGSDTTCLRAYLRKLVVIHNRIRKQSGLFVHRMSQCDRCQAIKLRFKRWLKRQVSKRRRIHLQLGLCSNTDTECMQTHASRIKAISDAIRVERAKVLAEHGACVATTTAVTTKANVTAPPANRVSAGAVVSAGVAGMIAVVLAVMLL